MLYGSQLFFRGETSSAMKVLAGAALLTSGAHVEGFIPGPVPDTFGPIKTPPFPDNVVPPDKKQVFVDDPF